MARMPVSRMGPHQELVRLSTIRAFCGPKIVESPCWKVVQAQLSATDTVAPMRVKKSWKKLAGSHGMWWDYPQ